MNQYALYLRKSRADLDAEARGEGETLSKHRIALTAFAKRRGLLIVREYAEIVSGDTIAARPQMQALLADVKAGMYSGVIVNDIDRLGRGDSIDQEIIKLTFAAANCIIVTPNRDIDPANPTDQDMLDFSMFLARFEYRKIAQRMNQGRVRTAQNGYWAGGSVPFGYRLSHNDGKSTLEIDESTAPIVEQIFKWYAYNDMGYIQIAKRLDETGMTSTTMKPGTIKYMLANPVYIGQLAFGRKRKVSVIEDGQRVNKLQKSTPFFIENAFPAIIDMQTWNDVQERYTQPHRHAPPVKIGKEIHCPLSGLIVCAECGKRLVGAVIHGRELIVCHTINCPTSGALVSSVENALLQSLRDISVQYEHPAESPKQDNSRRISSLQRQAEKLKAQITRAQELVETGVYSPAEYINRKTSIETALSAVTSELNDLMKPSAQDVQKVILPQIKHVLDAYEYAATAKEKNDLLRSVIDHVIYHKTRRGAENLSIDVYPRLV